MIKLNIRFSARINYAFRGGLGWPYVGALAGLRWRPLAGLLSVCGSVTVYPLGTPLGLMWTPCLNGDAKGLAGRALHGGFGLGVWALVELHGDFGRVRPQFVCVEESLWGLELLWGP